MMTNACPLRIKIERHGFLWRKLRVRLWPHEAHEEVKLKQTLRIETVPPLKVRTGICRHCAAVFIDWESA